MTRRISRILSVLVVSGCAGQTPTPNAQGFAIANIEVEQRGRYADNRPTMMGICKGFLLKEYQVREFFDLSSLVRETAPAARYTILPCYSSGTATINGELYHWVIRAGGVGEFYNENDRFVKICGKSCCNKLPSIC